MRWNKPEVVLLGMMCILLTLLLYSLFIKPCEQKETYNICIIANTSMTGDDFRTIASNFYTIGAFSNFVLLNK